jgi:hypothetical protein
MSRITEYTPVSAFDENDVLIKDGENGTKIISVEDAASEFRRLCGIDGDISDITDSLSAFGTNLAGVETTFIATKNYNIGDLFVIDGVLYRATATIASDSEIDPETNCEETSFSTVIEAMNDILAGKADANGTYENLIAGNAKQLVGTVFTEDDAAYTFRTAGGSADIGDREYDEIVGGSIVWNQLQQYGSNRTNNGVTYAYENGILSISGATNGSNSYWRGNGSGVHRTKVRSGHVYLLIPNCNKEYTGVGNSAVGRMYLSGSTSSMDITTGFNGCKMYKALADSEVYIEVRFTAGEEPVTEGLTYKPMFIDLTAMFGPTIADYIYNLETATAGAGVAWFRKYFPKEYYEYNAGEIMSVEGLTSHDLVGFNMEPNEGHVGWIYNSDGAIDKNASTSYASTLTKMRCLPNTEYCVTVPGRSSGSLLAVYIVRFDIDGNFISNGRIGTSYQLTDSHPFLTFVTDPNTHYFALYFYRASPIADSEVKDICVNLSWDGERDGEYEPYVKHSYPLDPTLTLRGIPVLSGGNLAYDGDRYKADGTVERRYGIVDLGTLSWTVHAADTGVFKANVTGIKRTASSSVVPNLLCDKYATYSTSVMANTDKMIGKATGASLTIYAKDSDYANMSAEDFGEAMSGVYLVYELEEPTEETVTAYQSPQIVDDFGTEEYVTTSIVPVGHETKYDSNLRAKLEMAPNSPDGDGDYLVRQTSGQNEYIPYTDGGRITTLEGKIPSPPSTDGAYVLTCTVADGTPTYSWVSA